MAAAFRQRSKHCRKDPACGRSPSHDRRRAAGKLSVRPKSVSGFLGVGPRSRLAGAAKCLLAFPNRQDKGGHQSDTSPSRRGCFCSSATDAVSGLEYKCRGQNCIGERPVGRERAASVDRATGIRWFCSAHYLCERCWAVDGALAGTAKRNFGAGCLGRFAGTHRSPASHRKRTARGIRRHCWTSDSLLGCSCDCVSDPKTTTTHVAILAEFDAGSRCSAFLHGPFRTHGNHLRAFSCNASVQGGSATRSAGKWTVLGWDDPFTREKQSRGCGGLAGGRPARGSRLNAEEPAPLAQRESWVQD